MRPTSSFLVSMRSNLLALLAGCVVAVFVTAQSFTPTDVAWMGQLGVAAKPAYGGGDSRWAETESASTTVITLSNAIPAGSRAVLVALSVNASQTAVSATDERGNTWGKDVEGMADTAYTAILSAHVSTQLEVNDEITLTWGNPAYSYRWGTVLYVTGCAEAGQPDVTKTNTTYGTSVTAEEGTVADNTVIIGNVIIFSGSATYGSSAWNTINSYHAYGSKRNYYLYTTASTASAQDPEGTLSEADTWGAVWSAYK